MDTTTALAILEQASALALMKKADHIKCEEALGVLKKLIEGKKDGSED